MNDNQTVRSQILRVVDPTGHHSLLADLVSGQPENDKWLEVLSHFIDQDRSELRLMTADYRNLLDSMEDAVKLLVPRGWAPLKMDSAAVKQAISLIKTGNELEADNLLADQWDGNGAWRTKAVHVRVSALGAGERQDHYHQIFKNRARLIEKARQHHEAGNYEASIPLIQAQMEGIVMDVAGGKKFYTKSTSKADLVNPNQLVGIEACLATLQAVYGQNVPETQSLGSLSRHGIAHGRELAYDTRVNSAKNWSVLDALVDWARPMAAREALRLREETEQANAGIEGSDDFGRRIDDREFRQTKAILRKLLVAAEGWHRQNGKFPADLIGGIYTERDFTDHGLSADHRTKMQVSSDGIYTWFWRETISGWILGAAIGVQGRGYGEWLYSGPDRLYSSPKEAPETWGEVYTTPPDWN